MKKGDIRHKNGFTIIEVSLVLAVAGLIFMVIFLALPALQRSQRDTERRDDMMELISNIKRYQQNNRGALPTGLPENVTISDTADKTSWSGFYKNYLGSDFADPSDVSGYVLDVYDCGKDLDSGEECSVQYSDKSFDDVYNQIAIVLSATCDGEKALKTSNPRKIAVLYHLEVGVYCGNT